MEIIVKKWEHFNKALGGWDSPKGKWISSKKQYDNECAKQGMIPYDKAKELVKKAEEKRERNDYGGLSKKAMSLITSVNHDKKGRIRLSDRQISTLKEVGATIEMPDWCPTHYQEKGGFADGK
jgi:hypothetical protein